MQDLTRCQWASLTDPLYLRYHDEEWGVPLHEDNRLFEFLVLEGAQAGLSWKTILNKRENFRKAYEGFDPKRVALFDDSVVKRLMSDSGIIRNQLKIRSAIQNSKVFMEIQDEFGSFADYVWKFVGHKPIVNTWNKIGEIPAKTAKSDAMSRDMIKRGFKFVGSTICYAFMQATGMVNDHVVGCFRYNELVEANL